MNRLTKFAAVAVAATAIGLSQASAMTENWSALSTTFLTGPSGTTGVPSGGLMQIGILGSNTVVGLQALQDNPVGLFNAFVDWQSGNIGDGTGVDGTFTIASGAPGAGFFSTQIYLLVFNSASANTATQTGLFTNPNWVFPASDGAAANSLDLGDAGLVVVIGGFSAGTVTSPLDIAGGDAAQLHLVPEPSSIALAALGLLGLVGFARRRRS